MPKPCRRFARVLVIVGVATCSCLIRPVAGRDEPWRRLTALIMSTSDPDSTAVLVLFDKDVADTLRRRLPKPMEVVALGEDVPNHGEYGRAPLGRMYDEASTLTSSRPDVWVVGRRSGSRSREHAARFVDVAASMHRRRVLRDSLKTPQGTVKIERWVDRPGGTAQRAEMRLAQAYADSVMAAGIPGPTPITRPFTHDELQIDPDTLSLYVAKLADTSFYSIGGCSEVEIVFWTASERLARLGPGVVPVLVERIADPNPFVRERVQEALLLATQDESILARTGGEYLKFYDQPGPPPDVVGAWWARFGHFWVPADGTR